MSKRTKPRGVIDGHPDATRVYELRERLGLSQEQFAETVGLARSSLCHIEAGRRGMPSTHDVRMRMADAAGVPVERLDAYLGGDIKLDTLMRKVST